MITTAVPAVLALAAWLAAAPIPIGVVSTVAGLNAPPSGCGSSLPAYVPSSPSDVAVDPQGRLVIAEFNGDRVVRIELDGTPTVLAGNGKVGDTGDGGPAVEARLNVPFYLAFDSSGRLYLSDTFNGKVRRIEADGTIHTVAGGGTRELDGISPLETRIRRVGGIAFDALGRLYFVDMTAARVRRIDLDGKVRTVARGPSDVPPGTPPDLLGAGAVAIDADGSLFVTEFNGSRVRRIAPDGTATTVAGSGARGFSGDGGSALAARFDNPWGLAIRPDGLYVVDAANQRVRRVNRDGTVETVAGGGRVANWGDGGPATAASMVAPCCIAFDAAGSMLVNDARGAVRKVSFGRLSRGDLDGDGRVTLYDARLLLRFVAGIAEPSTSQFSAGDLNGDGRLTIGDVVTLLKTVCPG